MPVQKFVMRRTVIQDAPREQEIGQVPGNRLLNVRITLP